jgi:hypothetical protein
MGIHQIGDAGDGKQWIIGLVVFFFPFLLFFTRLFAACVVVNARGQGAGVFAPSGVVIVLGILLFIVVVVIF